MRTMTRFRIRFRLLFAGGLVALAIASGLGLTALATARVQGGSQMAEQQLYQLREVSSTEDRHSEHGHSEDTSHLEPDPARDIRTLDQVKHLRGTVYVPSYLPAGFGSREVQLAGSQAVALAYRKGDHGQLIILQDSVPAEPEVGAGHTRIVSVNGQPAHLVDGTWVTYVRDGVASTEEWEPGEARSLYFQQGDIWVLLVVSPAQLDEAELVKVAESLTPY